MKVNNLPASWRYVEIGQIATPMRRRITVEPNAMYRTMGVKWWGLGPYERETKSGIDIKGKTLFAVKPGDLIINKIWVRHGSSGVVPSKLDGCVVTSDFPTFELEKDAVLGEWLTFLFLTKWFWQECESRSRGTSGRQRIDAKEYLKIEIPLPTIGEQRRIVNKLDVLFNCARGIKSASDETNKGANAVVQSKFHALTEQHRHRTTKSSFLEIAALNRRKVNIDQNEMYQEIGVYSYGRGIFHKEPRTGAEVGDKDLYQIKNGDFILQITFAWEGAVALAGAAEDGLYGSVRFPTFRVDESRCHPQYLLLYFNTPEGVAQLGNISPGSAGRNRVLSIRRLSEVKVPLLPLELQHWLVEKLEPRVNAIHALQAGIEEDLEAFMPSVLDKAFRGGL